MSQASPAAIQVKPGTDYPEIILQALYANGSPITGGNLTVTALKDVTLNAANDLFTYTQLNQAGKSQVPTTSTNSLACNMIVDEEIFFGNASATASTAAKSGILGLSTAKTKCNVSIDVGSKTVTGKCYVTALAPTVSADSPVWVSPITLAIDGDFAVA